MRTTLSLFFILAAFVLHAEARDNGRRRPLSLSTRDAQMINTASASSATQTQKAIIRKRQKMVSLATNLGGSSKDKMVHVAPTVREKHRLAKVAERQQANAQLLESTYVLHAQLFSVDQEQCRADCWTHDTSTNTDVLDKRQRDCVTHRFGATYRVHAVLDPGGYASTHASNHRTDAIVQYNEMPALVCRDDRCCSRSLQSQQAQFYLTVDRKTHRVTEVSTRRPEQLPPVA